MKLTRENYKDICQCDFLPCGALESIEIPPTVTEIESKIFSGMRKLVYIDMQCNITTIPECMCFGTNIYELTLPPTIEVIGDCAFEHCPLESLDVPALRILGKSALANSGIERLVLPPSMELVNSYALKCSEIKSLEIQSDHVMIRPHAVAYCKELHTLILPTTPITIAPSAFKGSPHIHRVLKDHGYCRMHLYG